MNNTTNNSMRFFQALLILMSLLLVAVTCAKAIKFKVGMDELPGKMASAITAADPKDANIKELQERFVTAAGDLKKKGMFAIPKPGKVNPVKKVDAIMGAEALINNKWYKAGDSIGEAKLVIVGTAEVTIEWNGKKTKLSPIAAPTKYAVVAKPKPVVTVKTEKVKTVEVVEEVKEEVVEVAAPAEVDDLAWIGVKLSPALKAKFLEQWNKMTDEQKEQGKKQWESMSSDQKQKMVDQMEQNIDQL